MTHTDPIQALVDLKSAFEIPKDGYSDVSMPPHQRSIVLAAIEALKRPASTGKDGVVERVAKAICEFGDLNNPMALVPGDNSPNQRALWESYKPHARAALAALKPMADVVEKGGCKMAWKQGFCYGDPEYYPPPSASTGKDGDYYMSTDEDAEQESLEIDEFPLEDR